MFGEQENKKLDILVIGLDRKIVKPLSECSSLSRAYDKDKRLLLKDFDGIDYLVNACRKEHVKLIYDGPEGGLLEKIGLCNHLVDVYAIAPGKNRFAVGGSTLRNYSSAGCICGNVSLESSQQRKGRSNTSQSRRMTRLSRSRGGDLGDEKTSQHVDFRWEEFGNISE